IPLLKSLFSLTHIDMVMPFFLTFSSFLFYHTPPPLSLPLCIKLYITRKQLSAVAHNSRISVVGQQKTMNC
ncbi:hypothetical protein, partial [Wolbachia endosymbiont of Bemisia tabaci]|uniref:hypothetical protein n=1 Tax=Wolbachia endosymbiont of Bemisia tabaci TaxID=215173 RepID=UPI001C54C33A